MKGMALSVCGIPPPGRKATPCPYRNCLPIWKSGGPSLSWAPAGKSAGLKKRSHRPGEDPELITPKESHLEFGLYRLKTATPRAQGGYGLAILLPEDTITVQRFMDKVHRETADQIVLAQLPRQGAKIKLRQLVENIVGRPLQRGESTDGVIQRQIRGQYNIIVTDNAERLHYSTLLWICSNLRSIVEAFLLVVRDEEIFMKMVDKTIDPGWTLGRSISIDLIELAAED